MQSRRNRNSPEELQLIEDVARTVRTLYEWRDKQYIVLHEPLVTILDTATRRTDDPRFWNQDLVDWAQWAVFYIHELAVDFTPASTSSPTTMADSHRIWSEFLALDDWEDFYPYFQRILAQFTRIYLQVIDKQ